jgi:hypothetical protein
LKPEPLKILADLLINVMLLLIEFNKSVLDDLDIFVNIHFLFFIIFLRLKRRVRGASFFNVKVGAIKYLMMFSNSLWGRIVPGTL